MLLYNVPINCMHPQDRSTALGGAEGHSDRATEGGQRDRGTEGQSDRGTERQRGRATERQTERQRDRETERQRDRHNI